MPEKMPKYKPAQHVMFHHGSGYSFAQIEGGESNGESWTYTVQNPTNPIRMHIGESDIVAVFRNDRWHDAKTNSEPRVTFL